MSLVVGIVAAVALAVCGATALSHAEEEVYAIPGWGVTLTVALLFLGLVGAALVAWARQTTLAAGILVATALVAFGLLAILSVGFIVLVAGVAVLAWTLRRAGAAPRRAAATGGAALAGVALPLLLVIALSGPVVDCGPGGTSAGENLFMSFGGGTTEVSSTEAAEGPEKGHARGDAYSYTFTCEDDRLVEFDLTWR